MKVRAIVCPRTQQNSINKSINKQINLKPCKQIKKHSLSHKQEKMKGYCVVNDRSLVSSRMQISERATVLRRFGGKTVVSDGV